MVQINEKPVVVGNGAAAALSKLSVVVGIPAFNEGKTIARVVLEAQRYGQVAGLFEVAIAFGVA